MEAPARAARSVSPGRAPASPGQVMPGVTQPAPSRTAAPGRAAHLRGLLAGGACLGGGGAQGPTARSRNRAARVRVRRSSGAAALPGRAGELSAGLWRSGCGPAAARSTPCTALLVCGRSARPGLRPSSRTGPSAWPCRHPHGFGPCRTSICAPGRQGAGCWTSGRAWLQVCTTAASAADTRARAWALVQAQGCACRPGPCSPATTAHPTGQAVRAGRQASRRRPKSHGVLIRDTAAGRQAAAPYVPPAHQHRL